MSRKIHKPEACVSYCLCNCGELHGNVPELLGYRPRFFLLKPGKPGLPFKPYLSVHSACMSELFVHGFNEYRFVSVYPRMRLSSATPTPKLISIRGQNPFMSISVNLPKTLLTSNIPNIDMNYSRHLACKLLSTSSHSHSYPKPFSPCVTVKGRPLV